MVELARRGDLVLSRGTDGVGVFREVKGRLCGPGAYDRGEWRWVLVAAGPLARQILGPEPDRRDSPAPKQTTLAGL